MRKVLFACMALLVVLGAAAAWSSASRPDIPPGVDAREWKPLSQDLGLVLQIQASGEISGHFMAKVGDQWKVVPLLDPSAPDYLPAR